jgi:uncharacterized membrane protein YeaQ/YmgE (transglycosylase-associated protein family)
MHGIVLGGHKVRPLDRSPTLKYPRQADAMSWGERMNYELILVGLLCSAFAGWLASRMMGDIGLGVIGFMGVGIIGGLLFSFIPVEFVEDELLNRVIKSTFGAVVLLQVANMMKGR